MSAQKFAVAAAAVAAVFASSAQSQEMTRAPMTTFFVSIPLDAASRNEAVPNFGLQFQGSKPYQSVKVDYQTFRFLPAAIAAMEVKYIVAGAVAVGAAVAVTKKDGKTAGFQQQQAQQQAACPQVCAQ
jgi:hypothetical protein